MVWCGVVWCGLVWTGVDWCGLIECAVHVHRQVVTSGQLALLQCEPQFSCSVVGCGVVCSGVLVVVGWFASCSNARCGKGDATACVLRHCCDLVKYKDETVSTMLCVCHTRLDVCKTQHPLDSGT